jgi:hypothetical protein
MAELPQPIELPRDIISVMGLINSRAKEFFVECWFRNSGFYQDNFQAFSNDFLGWFCVVLIVPALIYRAAELALFGMEMPSKPTRSRLEANYGEWAFTEIRRVKPEILDEIEKDRPNEEMIIGAPAQESGFVGIYDSTQEPEREGSQSGAPIPPSPTPTGVVLNPSTTTTESFTPDVTSTLISPPQLNQLSLQWLRTHRHPHYTEQTHLCLQIRFLALAPTWTTYPDNLWVK